MHLAVEAVSTAIRRQMRGNAAARFVSVTFMTQTILKQSHCWKRRAKAIESGTMNITNLQLAKCRFGMQFASME
jgi:hypothetical protein